MPQALTVVKQLTPAVGWALVKSWCNGWNTDTRVAQTENSSCRFCAFGGELGADRLSHLLECDLFWEPTLHSVSVEISTPLTLSPSLALCLQGPEAAVSDETLQTHAQVLCIACDYYQTVAASQRVGKLPRPIPATEAFAHAAEALRLSKRQIKFRNNFTGRLDGGSVSLGGLMGGWDHFWKTATVSS